MSLRSARFLNRFGKVGKRSDSNLQPLDLLLSAVGTCMAVYSAGRSLGSPPNGELFCWITVFGSIFALIFVRAFGEKKVITWDAAAYTLLAIALLFATPTLSTFLPDDLYNAQLTVPGALSFILAIGSFFVWRDQTMLFQAIPSVALFGLVGCYDTYREGVVLFFVFLLCQTVLLFRANSRTMLRMASNGKASRLADLRREEWRWMAGPEVAVASAVAIVLVSVVAAPVLRDSASGISGIVTYSVPLPNRMTPSVVSQSGGGLRVGNGPNRLTGIEVMRVAMDQPRYLRLMAYGKYQEGRWQPASAASRGRVMPGRLEVPIPNFRLDFGVANLKDPEEISFEIEPAETVRLTVAVPGDGVRIFTRGYAPGNNLGLEFTGVRRPVPNLRGTALVRRPETSPQNAATDFHGTVPDFRDSEGIPADVVEFAKAASASGKTDFEKAKLIQRAIEAAALYDLDAAATPAGVDPVSNFLFQAKRGYCDLFASSMVLSARSIGLPARLVTGYLPDREDRDGEGRFLVRQRHAHAWAEILFQDAGWVVFDATEGAVLAEGSEIGADNAGLFWRNKFVRLSLSLLGGLIACFGLYIAGFRLVKLVRSGELSSRVAALKRKGIQKSLDRQYLTFERKIRRTARRPRKPSETMSDYIRIASLEPRVEAQAREIGWTFAELYYKKLVLMPEDVRAMRLAVKEFSTKS